MSEVNSMAVDIRSKLNDASLFIERGLINGQYVASETGKVFAVTDPATKEMLGVVPDFTKNDIVRAIQIADAGYRVFSVSFSAADKGNLLHKWYNLILANIDDLATILSLENGKTLREAQGEVIYAASFVKWFAEEAPRQYGETIPSSLTATQVFTYKEPVGVCGIITPWNFPAAMITRKIAPALAAGCSVVIKPPSETPFSCIALAKLALDAGLPASCIHVVPTKDRTVATELAINPLVQKLSFTGSTSVGKMLTSLAAKTMKAVSMELGGNAPFIVFEDADLEAAVEGLMVAKFRCSGQTCVCVNRILVHESVVQDFTVRLVAKARELRCGPGLIPDSTQGPLVNASAVQKVHSHVQDALEMGAELKLGGELPAAGGGYFYPPTVVTGVARDMLVMSEETFGPLAAVFAFKSEEEAVELANSTEFGLAGYFFSRDIARIFRVSKAMQCGMIGVNTGIISAAENPFGGIKESGLGREGSLYGIAEYQVVKSVMLGSLN